MLEVRQHDAFAVWLDGLRDISTKAVIGRRIEQLERGVVGDVKFVGSGVRELRIDYGPGFRVYFVQRGAALIILLCGGDKSSQRSDIARAIELADEV